jgi:aspartate/methionine/tyrosine aminotransferase
VLVVNSFSKYFGMTGFRVGWLVAPPEFVPAIDRLAQNLFLAPPTVGQHAALAAFEPETLDILEERRREFGARRDFLLPKLREMGFRVPVDPVGAFYVYADASAFTTDSLGFCQDLLEKAGVVVTPGVDFGHYRAETHLRFAYTTGLDRLQIGLERLEAYLKSR